MDRREALRLLLSVPTLGACERARKQVTSVNSDNQPEPRASSGSMPVLFLAHGAPVLLDDQGWVGELAGWARRLPRPKSILMISAHWEARPATFGATHTVPLVYDFYGFPERYYQVTYPAPGAPELALRLRELFTARSLPIADDDTRGLDHGAYVPLVAMYPQADVPVLQLSLPGLNARELFEVGRVLEPLRREGVLIVGSGFLTHNMRFAFKRGTPAWASEFDHWVAEALSRKDSDALIDFENRAPAARMALPTTEHYVPVLVAAGAATESSSVGFPITGFWMDGAFTRRSVEFS